MIRRASRCRPFLPPGLAVLACLLVPALPGRLAAQAGSPAGEGGAATAAETPAEVRRALGLLGPGTPQLLVRAEAARARSSMARGLPSRALFHLDQALSIDPDRPRLHALRARALEELARWPAASTAWEWALQTAADLPQARRKDLELATWEARRARVLLELDAPGEAWQSLERSIAQGADPEALRLLRARAALGRGEFEQARELLPEDGVGEADLVRARILLEEGKTDEAARVLGGVDRRSGRLGEASELLRADVLEAEGRTQEAEDLRQAVEESRSRRAEGRSLLYEGVRALQQDQRAPARGLLERAAERLPEDPHVAAWRCLLEARDRGRAPAMPHCRAALDREPGHPVVLEVLADLEVAEEDYGEALRYLEAARRRDPDAASLYLKWGGVLVGLGRINDGLRAYLLARELGPEDPRPYMALAALHESLARPRAAQVLRRQGEVLRQVTSGGLPAPPGASGQGPAGPTPEPGRDGAPPPGSPPR